MDENFSSSLTPLWMFREEKDEEEKALTKQLASVGDQEVNEWLAMISCSNRTNRFLKVSVNNAQRRTGTASRLICLNYSLTAIERETERRHWASLSWSPSCQWRLAHGYIHPLQNNIDHYTSLLLTGSLGQTRVDNHNHNHNNNNNKRQDKREEKEATEPLVVTVTDHHVSI